MDRGLSINICHTLTKYDLHNEVAVKMRKYLLERIPEASITILCYYSASVKRIAALDPEFQVYTINWYQGRDCDFCNSLLFIMFFFFSFFFLT